MTEKNLEQMLREDGLCVVTVSGSSMQPMLYAGDRVLLTVPERPPEKGTVALYRGGESYVLHRIIGKKKNEYILCGDHRGEWEYVPENGILAVLEGFWREGSYYDCTGAYGGACARRAKKTLPLRVLRARAAKSRRRWIGREKTTE